MDIQSTLTKFQKLNILVIGDIMLDHYIMGDATRISPEAPVPVVSVASDRHVPGGAANVANNLAGLGICSTLLGSYSDDHECVRLRERLESRQIKLSNLGQKQDIPTILKTRVIVTLGADGMLLGEAGRIIGRITTEAREVFDVSGAGDTVVAALTAALAAGECLQDAAALANKAAGIVVGHLGTAPINSAELLEASVSPK